MARREDQENSPPARLLSKLSVALPRSPFPGASPATTPAPRRSGAAKAAWTSMIPSPGLQVSLRAAYGRPAGDALACSSVSQRCNHPPPAPDPCA